MPRLRQQHWFCLAALCLAGTLVMIWSPDVRVAENGTPETPGSALVRRKKHSSREAPAAADRAPAQKIPHFPEMLSGPNLSSRIDGSGRFREREPMIAVPIPVSAGELTSASVLVPAAHQHPSRTQVPASVWLEGKIEPLADGQ
jgi:hypothetical protein